MDKNVKLSIKTATLPETVHGVLHQTGNNAFTIYLNDILSDDEQTAAFLHEALHLYHDDTNSKEQADAIESHRHAELKRLLQMLSQK